MTKKRILWYFFSEKHDINESFIFICNPRQGNFEFESPLSFLIMSSVVQ